MAVDSPVQYLHLTEWDWPQVYRLWTSTDHLVLRADDSPESFRRLLHHSPSPSLSFGARTRSQLIGAVLAGYDGHRGYLYHMAVARDWHRQGIGSELAHHALIALRGAGAHRIHVLVEPDNSVGITFWQRAGFQLRTDVNLMTLQVC